MKGVSSAAIAERKQLTKANRKAFLSHFIINPFIDNFNSCIAFFATECTLKVYTWRNKMNATVLDLRKNMKDVIAALNRNEKVTLSYRGRKKAVIVPCSDKDQTGIATADHSAFGMWQDRENIADVNEYVRTLRKGRF